MKNKIFAFLFVVLGCQLSFAKPPIYIETSWYETLKAQVPPPPAKDSPAQKADDQEVLAKQKRRTAQDCGRAGSEILVGIENFYGQPYGFLSDDQIQVLLSFFEQVRSDTSYFVHELKKDFPHPRPFQAMTAVHACVFKETSDSYPSGHATISQIYALALADLYPQKKTELEARALQIAQDRVVAGVHYPNDIREGREVAKMIYAQMKKSPRFESELSMLKKKIQE